mgnify:CR=1 FL=1
MSSGFADALGKETALPLVYELAAALALYAEFAALISSYEVISQFQLDQLHWKFLYKVQFAVLHQFSPTQFHVPYHADWYVHAVHVSGVDVEHTQSILGGKVLLAQHCALDQPSCHAHAHQTVCHCAGNAVFELLQTLHCVSDQ